MRDLADELEEYGSHFFVEEFLSGGFRYLAPRPENVQHSAKCRV